MSNKCDIIPQIKNKNGEWVDSLLFTSLLENLKDRELAKKAYAQVHSKEFLNWFGDWINNPETASKVVDENGEPMVVYHGSNNKFDEFSKDAENRANFTSSIPKKGIYLSSHKYTANSYSTKNGQLVAAYINAKSPLELNKDSEETIGIAIAIRDFTLGRKVREGHLGVKSGEFRQMRDDKFNRELSDKDSIIIYNIKDGILTQEPTLNSNIEYDHSKLENTYVVFKSNQIKSISNSGKFSSELNNIYASPEVNEFENLEKELGMRNSSGELKRYDKKRFKKTHQEVIRLNKSGSIPRGHKATRVTVAGEKGDKKTYDAIRIEKIVVSSQESPRSTIVQAVFGDKKVLSSKEVLQGIMENSKNKPIWATMARKLLGLISNNVPIEVISAEEMSKYATFDAKGNSMLAGGLYLPSENKIYIQPNQDVKVLIHEILHAFSYHHLRSNSQASAKLKSIYDSLKKNHSDKFTSVKSEYAMQNLDEFMVGVFSNPEFMTILKTIPSSTKRKFTVWQELVEFFTQIFDNFGLTSQRAMTAFEESMEAAIEVLEESKAVSDSYASMEEYEEMYASMSDEEFVEDLHKETEKEDNILANIIDGIDKTVGVLKDRTKNATTKEAVEKLKVLSDRMKEKKEKSEDLEAIQEYIKSASEIIPSYKTIMEEIKNQDSVDNIDNLNFIHKFLGVFGSLSNLQMTMFKSEIKKDVEKIDEWNINRIKAESEGRLGQFLEENEKPVNTTETLDKVVKELELIHHDYLEHGRDLSAKVLFAQYSEDEIKTKKELKAKILKENPNDAYGLSLVTTWQELAIQMKEASRDINSLERWTSSAFGGSTNDLIALASKMMIDSTEGLTQVLREYEEELGEAHEEYIKESGINRNNVKAVNEPFIEVIEVINPDGSVTKTKHFITEFNMEEYSANKSRFHKENNHLWDSNRKLYNKKYYEWLRQHTQPKANAEDIIATRKQDLSEYEFEQWSKNNYSDYNGKRTYKGELVEPGAYYRTNTKLSKLTPAQAKYFKVLKKTMDRLKLLIPQDQADRFDNMVPSVYKGAWEFASEGEWKKIFKDGVKKNEGDIEYGLVDLAGKNLRTVPIHYTSKLDADLVSDDLLQSLLLTAKSWETYHAKSKINSEIQLLEDLMSYDNAAIDKFKVAKTSVSNGNIIDKASSVGNMLTKEGATNIQERMIEAINDLHYGIEEEDSNFSVPFFGDISGNKTTSTVLKSVSILQLAGTWVSGTVNAAMGNLNNLIEAHSGEHIRKRDLVKGAKLYGQHMIHFIQDRGKLHGKHWFTKMTEDFDFLFGEYVDSFGHNVSGNRAKKLAETSTLMVVQTGPEHEIAVTNGLAYMNSIKWINGTWIDRATYNSKNGDKKTFDSAKSLLDAHIEGEGKLVGEYAGTWTIKDTQKLKHRTQETNKYVQGNYSKQNRMALQRRWYGKLVAMFRKYVMPGFARRYGKERFNHATGTVMEGSYRSTAKILISFYKHLMEETKQVGILEAIKGYQMTSLQRQNLRRVVGEVGTLLAIVAIVAALTPDDDEEKNGYWANLNLLLARRMQSELSFYLPPYNETWRILKSPTVAMGTVDGLVELGYSLAFEWGDDAVYKRDTGMWEKGDSKTLAKLVKNIPILKGVLTGVTPEEQLKVFNR